MAHQMYVFVVCACFLGFSASLGRPRLMPGGLYPDARPVDATASEVVNSVKDDIVARLPAEEVGTGIFEPISYKTQVVAGTNYFVKIKTAADRYIHARIYRHFSGSTSLSDVQTGKTLEDEITYF